MAKECVHEYFDPGLQFALRLGTYPEFDPTPDGYPLGFLDISLLTKFRTKLVWEARLGRARHTGGKIILKVVSII